VFENNSSLLLCGVLGVDIVCERCQLTMREIPDTSHHYSDHEGVEAVFTVKRNVTGISTLCHFSPSLISVHCAILEDAVKIGIIAAVDG